ncbi:MAG TPA: anti-sigma factor [Burkholderiales bacterium]|nr:anti-sigma factor [Burkholderiales bacterium]
MSTKPIEQDLHAWLDGELDAARRAEIERYLASHPDETARLDAYARNEQALRAYYDPVVDEPVPPRLTRVRAPGRSRVWRFAAVLAWVAIGGVAGWHLHGVTSTGPRASMPGWAHRAAVAHVVYSPEVRHPVEVPADQEAHLTTWLSKRLGTPLRVPRLEGVGYQLVGGRLLPGEQGPAAHFMYQDAQGQRLTLYIRVNRGETRETAFRFAQEGNVRVFYWIDRGLGYALSGEIGKDDLLRVATAVHQHLNP